MKLLYISNARIPTEKAHGLQIMKTCEAFADLGHTVTLLVPRRFNAIADEPFGYYGARRSFEIVHIWSWDLVRWGKIGFLIQYVTFSIATSTSRIIRGADLIYGRDELVLSAVSIFSRVPILWESHVGAWNIAARFIAKRVRAIVVISQGLKDFYVEHGVAPSRIVVAHDGIDLDQFANPESKESARVRLGLPSGKNIVMYIGRLDSWKGIDTLLDASKMLSKDTLVVVIGGEPRQVEKCSRAYPNVKFLGYRPYKELPENQAAADVLVLPNTGKDTISARFTSPLKLFTYMASGRPIIASDLPSVREILDEESAIFFKADMPRSLAEAIQFSLDNPVRAADLAKIALAKVHAYTWKARAERILSLDIIT